MMFIKQSIQMTCIYYIETEVYQYEIWKAPKVCKILLFSNGVLL